MSLHLALDFSEFNLRVVKSTDIKVYEFDDFCLDAEHLMLYREGEPVPVPPRAVETLLALIKRRGEIVSKDELIQTIWKDAFVEESNLFLYLSLLRKSLGKRKDGVPYLETLRRRGYRFNGVVRDLTTTGVIGPNSVEPSDVDEREPSAAATQTTRIAGNRFIDPILANYRFAALAVLVVAAVASVGAFYWNSFSTNERGVPRTIAILPFKPLKTDDRDEFLELGMADTLITRLGKNKGIVVRPLGSVHSFNRPGQDPIAAGRELRVEAVLDSSLQRLGDRIRVNTRLIKVADGTVIWADMFDKAYRDIFELQSLITTRIANALDAELTGNEAAHVKRQQGTTSTDAYDAFIRGRYHMYRMEAASLLESISFYEKAVAIDPNFAAAHANMADACRRLGTAGFAPGGVVFRKALESAEKAIQIDNSIGVPHMIVAWVAFVRDRDLPKAEREFRLAIELEPTNSDIRIAYAHLLNELGRHDEAVAEARLARELSPMTLIVLALESYVLLEAGRAEEAVVQAQKALEFDPSFWVARLHLGNAYASLGRFGDAIAELERAQQLAPESARVLQFLSDVLIKAKDARRLRDLLKSAELFSADNPVSLTLLAKVHNALGETSKALDLLEEAVTRREVSFERLQADNWTNLRNEPRFEKLLRSLDVKK